MLKRLLIISLITTHGLSFGAEPKSTEAMLRADGYNTDEDATERYQDATCPICKLPIVKVLFKIQPCGHISRVSVTSHAPTKDADDKTSK